MKTRTSGVLGQWAIAVGAVAWSTACSSPTPATSSSSNWATCSSMTDCASVAGAVACTGGYCVDSSGQRLTSGGGNPGPCDPLAPHELPVVLGDVLGIGKDPQGTVYMADHVASSSTDRVFVSEGTSLFRRRVNGSGSSGGQDDGDYTFSFEDRSGASAGALLIQRRGGVATAMGLGPGGKAFIGDPGAVTTELTVVGNDAIASLELRNLPGEVTIEYFGDIADGKRIVVTHPRDDYGDTDYRAFYGVESAMVERKVVQVVRARSGTADVTFTVDGADYIAHFVWELVPTDGGLGGHPGPGTLDKGGGNTVDMTERYPTPTTLPGLSFTCL